MDNYKADYYFAIVEIFIGIIFLFLAIASCFVEVTVHPSLVFLSLSIGFQTLAKINMRR